MAGLSFLRVDITSFYDFAMKSVGYGPFTGAGVDLS
jgi:hypothetical protein